MSYASRGSGGGGGFGGFPYRSAHQQNNDGNRGNGNGRRKRFEKRRERGGALICQVLLLVPVDQRRIIIGNKGKTIKHLTASTKTVIDVPGVRNTNPNSSVKIRGSSVANVLHACWRLSEILTRTCSNYVNGGDSGEDSGVLEEESIAYKLTIQGVNVVFQGQLRKLETEKIAKNKTDCTTLGNKDSNSNDDHDHVRDYGAFMSGDCENKGTSTDIDTGADTATGGIGSMSAYCIHSHTLCDDTVSILVDNERFIDPSITAKVDIIPLKNGPSLDFENNDGTGDLNGETGSVSDGRNDGASGTRNSVLVDLQDNRVDSDSSSVLIFIYGHYQEKPHHIYTTLLKKENELKVLSGNELR